MLQRLHFLPHKSAKQYKNYHSHTAFFPFTHCILHKQHKRDFSIKLCKLKSTISISETVQQQKNNKPDKLTAINLYTYIKCLWPLIKLCIYFVRGPSVQFKISNTHFSQPKLSQECKPSEQKRVQSITKLSRCRLCSN